MKNVANKIFGFAAAGALALTPMAAANAEDVIPASNPTATAVATSAMSVQFIDASQYTLDHAREYAAATSHDKLAIIVWGGNRTLQQEAYNAARDLVGMGIPTAFVLAPDHNNSDAEAVMQVYAGSRPYTDAAIGTNHADVVRTTMREAGITAYREAFPQQVAALSLR